MATSQLPDVKKKQKILFSESATPKSLVELAERFFAAAWYNDALDFWERAEDSQGVQRVREIAKEEGDVFLLTRCLRAQGAEADESEWRALAERAHSLGKLQFAREGFRKAGDRKAMDKIDALIGPVEQAPGPTDEDAQAAVAGTGE